MAKASPKREVVTYDRDGIEVTVDLTWCRSWDGISCAARMGNKKLSEGERLIATGEYYSKACPNIDDVAAALEKRSDDEVDANAVMVFVSEAIRENTPKN